jgi:hypothetical protein
MCRYKTALPITPLEQINFCLNSSNGIGIFAVRSNYLISPYSDFQYT